MSQG
jgi:hypothetical protein